MARVEQPISGSGGIPLASDPMVGFLPRLFLPAVALFGVLLALPSPCSAQAKEAAAALPAVSAVPSVPSAPRKHPPIVNPAAAKCLSCHEEVSRVKRQHAPVGDGCLSCHEFATVGSGQTVRLSSPLPALCLSCHEGLRTAAEGKLSAAHAPAGDCTTCHKPHGSDVPGHLSARVPQLCLSCHAAEKVNKTHKVPVSRANCTSCHAPHGSTQRGMLSGRIQHAPFRESSCSGCHRAALGSRALLKGSAASLCYTCHADAEKRFGKAGTIQHGAVAQGLCTGCHDPHLSQARGLLRQPEPEICIGCHPAIRQKVTGKGAHGPAAEGCAGCHEPHTAVRPKLLKSAVPGLCLGCHPLSEKKPGKPGSTSLPTVLAAKHLGADLSKSACVSCHDPHGSERPHHLASGSVHEPFGAGSCGACHAGSARKLVARDVRSLCLSCHGAVAEAASKATIQHAAMGGPCTTCHDPHASALPKLVRALGEELCTPCHEGLKTRAGRVPHGATHQIGCQSCHLAHGGEKPRLLRALGNDLCNGCHLDGSVVRDAQGNVNLPGGFRLAGDEAKALRLISLDSARERNHPVPGHLVSGKAKASHDPRNAVAAELEGREITCLSCHGPHSGASKALFIKDIAGQAQLCQACHRK